MSALTREGILGFVDVRTERVDMSPVWAGKSVLVRSLSAAERDELSASITGPDGKLAQENWRAKFCSFVLSDADGNRLFGQEDVAALAAKSSEALDLIVAAGQALNKMGANAVDDEKKV